MVRVDRESRSNIDEATTCRLLAELERGLKTADAVILCDYAKGVITQRVLDEAKALCRRRGVWLSVDPKPSHLLDLAGVSLLTPNRKEAFELAGVLDDARAGVPEQDAALLRVADKLLADHQPALLLVTLGDQGMLLCQRGQEPFHIPTMAREVFDVSGAGDTVIASFTLAIVAGASPLEAAIFSQLRRRHCRGQTRHGHRDAGGIAAKCAPGRIASMNARKITADTLRAMKGRERIAALTAYDFAMTQWLDAAGVPLLLVGDSLGMVVLGYPDTTHVTMRGHGTPRPVRRPRQARSLAGRRPAVE